jgi:CO/xanthine dehydrogenase FAD-binding subunit
MEIREYHVAASLEEAYGLLIKSRQNCILGGCTFLRKTGRKIGVAVDLSGCGLSYIREEENAVRLGAYTTLRDMELSEILRREFGDVFNQVFRHLIGVQLRSHITIGAHVYSRYGFSDLIPVLLSLNARVRLFRCGEMALRDFMKADVKTVKGDILIEIILPEQGRRAKVQMMRSSYNDYSILCLAVSRAGDDWIVASGARPQRGALAEKAMALLNGTGVSPERIPELARAITDEFRFGTNCRGSAEYRRELCLVFAQRALEALGD